MEFEGEHLLAGQLGHFFIILAFVSSLLSALSYFIHTFKEPLGQSGWSQLARASFAIQTISLLSVFAIIFYICSNHYYEYMYVYKHASKELEPKYLLACIWEGQEGSFLLWALWNSVLGIVIILRKGEWEAPVTGIISLAQFFLCAMLLGIYFFDIRIGNSPFTLTRNELAGPIFSRPDYLNFVKDGMGLNVLLRNYWMVIHPPVLFLGFSSTLIPFAFACSGLLKNNLKEWTKPALTWSLFSAAVLGTGIMMGGKWAYESLSFGGYWAWDPVENASLVPWLLLVAGLHTLLIYKSTGHSLRASFLFIILTFSFVLYSTFLTRTGILGDTSVHAFTEAGSAINVMIGGMVGFFSLIPLGLLIFKSKRIPGVNKEEETSSREFWMFIGSLLFFISSVFIITITSIPVFNKTPGLRWLINKIHGGPLALPEDPEFLYNKVMVMTAILLGLMTAITQYLKYKKTDSRYLLKKIGLPTLISLAAAAVIFYTYPLDYHKYGNGFLAAIYIAFASMLYSLIANSAYIWAGFKGKIKQAGGSITHAGFALMLLGMLVSSANKKVISSSSVNGINLRAGTDPMSKKQDDPRDNLTLIRDLPTRMGSYKVTYQGDSIGHEKGRRFYTLHFDNSQGETFELKPDVYLMKDNNMSSNPDIRSYPTHDIFTYISYVLNDSEESQDTSTYRIIEMQEGDTALYDNGMLVLDSVRRKNIENTSGAVGALGLEASVSILSRDSMRYHAYPYIQVDTTGIYPVDDTVYAQNLFLRFAGVTEDKRIKLGVRESSQLIDFVTVKAYLFPYILLVWLGLVIMTCGLFISFVNRARLSPALSLLICVVAVSAISYMFLLAGA